MKWRLRDFVGVQTAVELSGWLFWGTLVLVFLNHVTLKEVLGEGGFLLVLSTAPFVVGFWSSAGTSFYGGPYRRR